MSATRPTLDVSPLPDHAFGHQGLVWWGTVGFMVIEGSILFMALVAYFVLRTRVPEWPPSLPNPDVTLGTINTLVLLASAVPNHMAKHAAEKLDVRRVRWLLPVCLLFGVAFIVIRAFEFGALNCRWDSNAYGSVVWIIMGLHTAHLVTDVLDTGVLTALVFAGHVEPPRMVDVSENALYWHFVVFIWLPIYSVVYLAPRWL
ncbi:MAG TPA: cytochrome c oxidase subunit 3 [Vicinamibacterales bacterium]